MPEIKQTKKHGGITCPKCHSGHIWKVGFVPTRTGLKARYKCVNCAYTFFPKKREHKAKKG